MGGAYSQQTITYTNGQNSNAQIVITSGTNPTTLSTTTGSATQSGTISESGGSYGIIKTGSGTLTINAANTYTGTTTLNGGTLILGNAGALGTSGSIVFTAGTLQFTAANTTDYSSRFSTANNQQYSFNTNGQSVTFAVTHK